MKQTRWHKLVRMRHAVIIGASGGIGAALSAHLKDDYNLSLIGRDTGRLKAVQARTGGQIIPTDVASELEVQALFDELAAIDLLVYAAGDIQPDLLKLTSGEAYRRVIDANLTGLLYTLKYAEEKLNKGSRVFVLGARPQLIRYRGFGVYAAAKAGVKALVEIAAIEMKRKASFTLVLPKAVDTDFWANVGTAPKDALQPEDVASAIVTSLNGEPEAELQVG